MARAKKREFLHVRLPADEKRAFVRAAEKERRDLSDWVRSHLRRVVKFSPKS